MHETRRVGSRDIFRPGGDVPLYLLFSHTCGNGWLLDGEHAAEAAALVLSLRLMDGDAVDELQEVDDLVEWLDVALRGRRQVQFSHSVAAVMHADRVGELSRHLLHLQHVVEELHYIHDFA